MNLHILLEQSLSNNKDILLNKLISDNIFEYVSNMNIEKILARTKDNKIANLVINNIKNIDFTNFTCNYILMQTTLHSVAEFIIQQAEKNNFTNWKYNDISTYAKLPQVKIWAENEGKIPFKDITLESQ